MTSLSREVCFEVHDHRSSCLLQVSQTFVICLFGAGVWTDPLVADVLALDVLRRPEGYAWRRALTCQLT